MLPVFINPLCSAVMVKNPSDFIGDVLGASENKTKAILATTVGKVLVIDEVGEIYCLTRSYDLNIFQPRPTCSIRARKERETTLTRSKLLLLTP